jgi:hypothetical protein
MDNSKLNVVYAGFDAGMGALKLWLGLDAYLEFISQVSVNGARHSSTTLGLKSSKPPLHIWVNGQSFYVGPRSHDWGRPIESLDYERLTGAPEMIALFYGALTQVIERIPSDVRLHLTVGLPYGSVSGAEGDANIVAVRKWMERKHEWIADDKPCSVHVASVKVATQATGALFDYLLDDAGKFIPERKGGFKTEVGVVSIGFNTVELQVVRNKEEVNRFTGGSTVGVRRLLEIADPQRLYSLGEMDAMLRAKRLDVSNALPLWEREVVGFIESKWGDSWRRFAAVLIVGGGAHLLNNTLPYRFNGKAHIPDQPVLSIARGLHKLTVLQNHKKGEDKPNVTTQDG